MKKLKMDKLVKAIRKIKTVKSRKKVTKIAAPIVATEVIVPIEAVPTTEAKVVEKKNELKPLRFTQNVTLGGDPEFFFAKDGKIIGSEKVLTSDGTTIAGTDGMLR